MLPHCFLPAIILGGSSRQLPPPMEIMCKSALAFYCCVPSSSQGVADIRRIQAVAGYEYYRPDSAGGPGKDGTAV